MYPYGLIGNCQTSALVSNRGSIDWLCFPRPDSPPVFGRLLDPNGGHFSVEAPGEFYGIQNYLPNSNILTTRIIAQNGSEYLITDFCPRFYMPGRVFRPMCIIRMIEPLKGSPHIRVQCKPVNGWEKDEVKATRLDRQLRFDIRSDTLALSTNMPLTYLGDDTPFALKEPLFFALSWGFGLEEENLTELSLSYLQKTTAYWDSWVKHCSIPTLYQRETIRSALTLKLHCYEDTGAILAALTTSLPEEDGSGRNWDYRFCWLRDAYFVLSAFHALGHFEEMEGFITFLLNIAEKQEHSRERLSPVYRLDQTLPAPEIQYPHWLGYRQNHPVRADNQAAEQVQNDVYGEMVLTLAPIYFDERFMHLRTPSHESLLSHLVRLCARNISKPDAGLWEIRNQWREHSFSNLMCWAGIERIQRIRERGFLERLEIDLGNAREAAEKAIYASTRGGFLRNGPEDDTLDSSLLQLPILRFPDHQLCLNTVKEIQGELAIPLSQPAEAKSFLYRYRRKDDFGQPKSAFLICSFWLVQALVRVGEMQEAHNVMKEIMTSANPLGLMAEHFQPEALRQMGNFPQAYSHVGQINAAFAISPPWDTLL